MKTKKLFLPTVILLVACVAIAVYAVIAGIAKKPTVTEHSFPFSITYEWQGETKTIDSVYEVTFAGNGGFVDTTERRYEGKVIGANGEEDTVYILSEGPEGSVVLYTQFYPDHLMGDPRYDYYTHDPYAPRLVYYDTEYTEHTDADILLEHGAKLIDWEYPEPITNSWTFSHIAHMNSNYTAPMAGIALLALAATVLLVRREGERGSKALAVVSTVFFLIILVAAVPFFVMSAHLVDLEGSNGDFLMQLMYLLPAITVLGLTASVGLRKKGYAKSGMAVQFVGPLLFAVMVAVAFL